MYVNVKFIITPTSMMELLWNRGTKVTTSTNSLNNMKYEWNIGMELHRYLNSTQP